MVPVASISAASSASDWVGKHGRIGRQAALQELLGRARLLRDGGWADAAYANETIGFVQVQEQLAALYRRMDARRRRTAVKGDSLHSISNRAISNRGARFQSWCPAFCRLASSPSHYLGTNSSIPAPRSVCQFISRPSGSPT
jgi:hypothetical protein